MPNFGFHLVFIGFHLKMFIVLGFEVVLPRRPQRPQKAELVGFQTMLRVSLVWTFDFYLNLPYCTVACPCASQNG